MKYLPLFLLMFTLLASPADARKVRMQLDAKEKNASKINDDFAGCFKVTSQPSGAEESDTDNRYSTSQITFTGYDKKINSSTESFFIHNNTDRTLAGIILIIEYLTTDGRQLEKRTHRIKCNIPAGETRKTDLKSWDKQHSFYYYKSAPTRSSGAPFQVKFSSEAIYLKF